MISDVDNIWKSCSYHSDFDQPDGQKPGPSRASVRILEGSDEDMSEPSETAKEGLLVYLLGKCAKKLIRNYWRIFGYDKGFHIWRNGFGNLAIVQDVKQLSVCDESVGEGEKRTESKFDRMDLLNIPHFIFY